VKRLTISFDNGPTPGETEKVLEALASRNVLASFFVVGEEVAKPGAREPRARKGRRSLDMQSYAHSWRLAWHRRGFGASRA
jgi:peptidoglycan/xylan/chitin deacetylase (PgdA/CDA1 family)